MGRSIIVVVIILVAACLQGCDMPPAPLANAATDVAFLGRMPDERPNSTFSDDGLHIAFVTQEHGKMRVVADGQAGPEFDDIDGETARPSWGSIRF